MNRRPDLSKSCARIKCWSLQSNLILVSSVSLFHITFRARRSPPPFYPSRLWGERNCDPRQSFAGALSIFSPLNPPPRSYCCFVLIFFLNRFPFASSREAAIRLRRLSGPEQSAGWRRSRILKLSGSALPPVIGRGGCNLHANEATPPRRLEINRDLREKGACIQARQAQGKPAKARQKYPPKLVPPKPGEVSKPPRQPPRPPASVPSVSLKRELFSSYFL